MIKRRFGEDFSTKLSGNLEIKVAEIIKKDNRGGKRKPREPRKEGEKGERKPREQKDQK
jgi:hypothetical protein